MQKELPDIAQELQNLLSSVNGVTGISENVTLSYIVEVSEEDNKENVEKVAEALCEQAESYNFELEIMAFTKDEIQAAKEKLQKHLQEKD